VVTAVTLTEAEKATTPPTATSVSAGLTVTTGEIPAEASADAPPQATACATAESTRAWTILTLVMFPFGVAGQAHTGVVAEPNAP
jgi:hypothetical protein